MSGKNPEVSVIISLTESQWFEDVETLFSQYKKILENSGVTYEFIYVTDVSSENILKKLNTLNMLGERINIVRMGRWFGSATALNSAFEISEGKYILTLPSYQQIADADVVEMILQRKNADMLIAKRERRSEHKLLSKIFHSFIRKFFGFNFHDLGCGVRLFKREILSNIYIYGDQVRYFPIIAARNGFKVIEYKASQIQKKSFHKVYFVRHYIQRLVDFISIIFVIKFTKQPLRLFGFPGIICFILGSGLALYLFYLRTFGGVALADKPIVLVSILLIVFGIQLLAIGLVAEIIIFTHSKDTKDYIIEYILNKEKEEEDMVELHQ